MQKEIESARKNGFLDSLKFEPILEGRKKAIMGELFNGCDDYRSSLKYVTKVAKAFLKHYPDKLAKIDFTDMTLPQILSELERVIEKEYVDYVNFYFPRDSNDRHFAYYRYTDDLSGGVNDLSWLIESENYSEEILSALWYLHNKFGFGLLLEDYESEEEMISDMFNLESTEMDEEYRVAMEISLWNYKHGFLSGYISMIQNKKEPRLSISKCIEGIENSSIIALLELVQQGYRFDADAHSFTISDEMELQPTQFFGFVWTFDEEDHLSKAVIINKDDFLGNYTCTMIGEKIKLHQIKKKFQVNHNLRRALWLMRNI